MYSNDNSIIELCDDLAHVHTCQVTNKDGVHQLHLVADLRKDVNLEHPYLRVHTTNGVEHRVFMVQNAADGSGVEEIGSKEASGEAEILRNSAAERRSTYLDSLKKDTEQPKELFETESIDSGPVQEIKKGKK